MSFFTPVPRRSMALWCACLAAGLLLCTAVHAAFVWSGAQLKTGQSLCEDTLRLHVRAQNDTLRGQTLKLQVRDAVLALADESCPAQSKAEALAWAAHSLPRIRLAAQYLLTEAGAGSEVQVRLVNMYFEAARYTGAALPAGRYDAVRVELGSGPHNGKNWWCVLYPGLCRSACGGYAEQKENDLVSGGCLVRFKLVDWWQQRTAARGDETLLAV